MKAYTVMWGDWDEVAMVVLAESQKDARMIVVKIDPRFAEANIRKASDDLTKPGVIFRYDR